ncbi:MAG: hypothetical protein KME17_24005 [Cyanosarcina radialis HA8281-LM2]|jgi:hypothetical protein|nr:hypothetical protein [Cyanosarcina radialis HA8281-LM2]
MAKHRQIKSKVKLRQAQLPSQKSKIIFCQKWFLLGIVAAIAIPACTGAISNPQQPEATRTANAPNKTQITPSKISSNVDDFLKLTSGRIELPYRPKTVLWQTIKFGDGVLGPSDWRLTGVMTFSPIDADKMLTAAKKPGVPSEDSIEVEDWFPDRLKTEAVKDPQTGKSLLKVKVYQVPVTQGRLMQVDRTSYWIVSLFTS